MTKEPKLVPGKQDVFCRRMYVIRARKDLIDHIKNISPESIGLERALTVVMTEEVPFEEDFEGWQKAIANKCKEAFLRDNIDEFPLTVLEKPESLLHNMNALIAFFDKWWIAERATDYLEIVRGSWKTSQCHEA